MNAQAQHFVGEMGLLCEHYGFSRIAGRMLGFFLIDGQPHSLTELAELLEVSKASVSTNARLLERRGVLERHSHPGDRRDYYRLSDSPWETMFEVARERMQRMERLLSTTAEELPEEEQDAVQRLEKWHGFYAFMVRDMDKMLDRWRKEYRQK